MNEWENDDSDKLLALYIGFIKKSGQCFFLAYQLTYLNKDALNLLKVMNI